MTKKQRKQEFIENRTSWEFFDKRMDIPANQNEFSILKINTRIQLEILKELQFLNDK
jgi:hypothetical protein